MFKGAVENKGTKPGTRDDFERQYGDSARPGFVKVGFWPQVSSVVQEAAKRGLRDHQGSLERFLPLPPNPDPNVVHRSEIPENLREDLARAEAPLAAHRAKVAAAYERWRAAHSLRYLSGEHPRWAFDWEAASTPQAKQEAQMLEAVEPPLRLAVARAEKAIANWMRDESLYRSGTVPRPEPSAGIF